MATREAYIPFNGPFKGVSVLPGRLAQGGFSPLAVNCDTSQGILRSRPGYRAISQRPNQRVLGVHSTNDYEGQAQTLAVYFAAKVSTEWGSLQLRVLSSDGSELASFNISNFPYDVVPGPYEFPVFVDYMSKTYILFPKGTMYEYDTRAQDLKKVRSSVITSNAIFPYFEGIPDGKIMEAHGRRLFMAGFTGDKPLSVTANIPSDQNLIPESVIDQSRAAVVLPMNAIVFSDFDDPTVWKSTNILAAPKGQKITGLASTESELLVFTESTVNVVRGFQEQAMQISTVAQGVGCVSHRTIVHGQGMTCWLSHNGWYMYSGGRMQKISDDIGDMFRLEGWRETPMKELGPLASEFQFPLCVSKSSLWQSCGGFDYARGAFMWSIPMLGFRTWINQGDDYSSLPAKSNNLTLVFYPASGTWDMWAPATNSSFYPTCYTSVLEGSNQYLMFGNEDGQLCIWGADTVDKIAVMQQDDGGGGLRPVEGKVVEERDSNDSSVKWFWMSPRLEASSNLTTSVRTLRVRQRAVGYQEDADKVQFYLETERAFDQSSTALSAKGYLDGSPDTGPPNPKTPEHYWNKGTWGNFNWAGRDVWKARYGIKSVVTGHTIRVGFSETLTSDKDFLEIHGFDIELNPRRDIT